MTVYADEAFLLNGAVDYLLLVCAAKLGGGRILRLRLALAAAFGGVYAAAALFPALVFLRQLPVKLASLAAMPDAGRCARARCSSRPSAPSAARRSRRRSCSAQACSCCRAERFTR